MSPRRTLSALGFGTLAAGLVAACLPWSIEAPAVSRFVSRGLQEAWGVALSARGRTEIVLLPLPRIVFQGIRLTEGTAEGPELASGGSLSLQLDLAALLTGRIEVESLTLDGADVLLPQGEGDPRWSGAAGRLARGLAEGGPHPRRVILARATVAGRDPRDNTLQTARDVDLTVSWPAWSESLALAGGLTWNGASARFSLSDLRLHALMDGGTSPFSAALTWAAGSLSAEGSGSLRDGFRASGSGTLQTRSVAGMLAWIGGDLALSPFVRDLSVEGSFEAAARDVQFPSVKVRTGGNLLEGAGSATFGPKRAAVQATLAADSLNLSPLFADLLRLTGFDSDPGGQAWQRRPLDLRPLTGGDLDLRVSAGSARIGPVQFSDIASSLLVREHGIEASLGRAGLQGGLVKGRVTLAAEERDRAVTSVKAQGSFDGLDLGAVLADLGQDRWAVGASRGSLALEGTGRDVGAFARSVSGRVAFASEDGAIAGLDLADVIHRGGSIAPGALARRNGRTPFERAAISLLFSDGVGEIVEGSLAARGLTASLRGRLSLPDRRFEARAELASRGNGAPEATPRAATLFEMAGPWEAVSVRAGAAGESAPLVRGFRRPGADLPLGIRAYVPVPSAGESSP